MIRRTCVIGSVWAVCLLLASCQDTGRLQTLAPSDSILAFGDSLTFGTGVKASDSYPVVLASLIDRPVIRSGVPGEISSQGLVRLRKELGTSNPALVVLCHGGNDILRRMSSSATKNNLTKMVELVRESGAEVVLVAVPNLSLFPKAASYYEDLEQELDVPIEYNILSQLQSDNSKKSDAVHFNSAGYRELAEAVAELLRSEGAL